MAMASSITDDSKESPSDHLSCCPPDEITEELQASESNTAVKAQKSGKFRRTALTFFGVRKTICILPSFFVGRSKNLSKWSSKKAIFKSKTHDGLSKVCHDDNHRGGYASAGAFVYDSHRDVAADLHSCCHNKLSPSSVDQKSLSLPRQKRGLRSLFQSIKQHRNNRNGIDKGEIFATRSETQVPIVQSYTEQHLTECLGSEPDVPDFDNTVGPQCTEDLEGHVLMKNSPKSKFVHELNDNQIDEVNLVALVSSDYEELSRVQSDPCLKLEMVPEPMLKSEATAGSCEQLNVMFEDVASLKSFDSLTGCGDIIADQEDDSITESTVSGERSRNGGKRASCYLTYQGGGEDMACPEDLGEEYPDNMWVNDASEEICCACNQDLTDLSTELTGSHNMDLMNSNSAQQGADNSTADVLTPQSEHQESVPNSDEGYYDSTTPGPEEGQEKAERLQPDRLPRDSYSGDALYELFAPDESLISPHYEKKSLLSGSDESEYLNKPVEFTDPAFLPDINDLKLDDSLYEAHSFLEMPCSKPPELTQNPIGLHESQAFVNKNMKTSASARKSPDAEYVKRHSAISFGSTSDPDFETFCEPKEQLLEENKPVALPYRNIKTQCTEVIEDVDNEQTVCFSQALEDFTKRTQMMSNLHNNMDSLETSPAFIPNMEALPAIVTFDVVNMHNEGEYDEQIQMDMEEELSSPYQEFEESYLQKDAFAECDYQTLDLYEQNLLSNTWAIASLPRHLGLSKVSQFLPAPLSQDRRSRSLDTEDLDLNMPEKCKNHRGALPSCFLMERERGSSSHKSLHVPLKDGSITSPWQTKSDMALSLCSTMPIPVKTCKSMNQTQLDTKTSVTLNTDSSKSLRLYSSTSDSASSELFSSPELYNRKCHLPLQTDSCLPHTSLYYTEMMEDGSLLNDQEEHLFDKAAVSTLSYNPSREAISQHSINSALSVDQTKYN
ncbi:APC membrane recruitment protein 1 [Boleophthalmus pectinirostris]|uniref:APC membrane recruitment protein 1 n=1 Tax=Boleophthalmus pectinirostris TaxID=150288 RepID=UPI00242DABB3|nr:APC membrane recruitment protein 1 [Boleophthalmus pectinirostris]